MLLNMNVLFWDEDVEIREDGVIDGTVVEAFTSGHCHSFALALLDHIPGGELYGWMRHSDEDDYPQHVVVRDPRGRLWDVEGEFKLAGEVFPVEVEHALDSFGGGYRDPEHEFAATFVPHWLKLHPEALT